MGLAIGKRDSAPLATNRVSFRPVFFGLALKYTPRDRIQIQPGGSSKEFRALLVTGACYRRRRSILGLILVNTV